VKTQLLLADLFLDPPAASFGRPDKFGGSIRAVAGG
jgi:hypothetical protein